MPAEADDPKVIIRGLLKAALAQSSDPELVRLLIDAALQLLKPQTAAA